MLRDLRVYFPSVVRQVDLLTGYKPRGGHGAETRPDQVAVGVLGAGARWATAGHGVEPH